VSGSNCPRPVISVICFASGVPALISSRTRSPQLTCGTPISLATRLAYVPLPTPGAPRNTQFRRPAVEHTDESSADNASADVDIARRNAMAAALGTTISAKRGESAITAMTGRQRVLAGSSPVRILQGVSRGRPRVFFERLSVTARPNSRVLEVQ